MLDIDDADNSVLPTFVYKKIRTARAKKYQFTVLFYDEGDDDDNKDEEEQFLTCGFCSKKMAVYEKFCMTPCVVQFTEKH